MEESSEKADSIFDQLNGIYQEDPEKFEKLSRELIQQALDDTPEGFRAQAYGIQRRVEHQLKKYKDPIARMNAMVDIFWEQFFEFNAVVHDPREVIESKKCNGSPAKVISFKGIDSHY